MKTDAEKFFELSMLFSKGSTAMSVLEAIASILDALEDEDLDRDEAIEEIATLVSEYLAMNELSNMTAEEIEEFVGDETPAGVKRLKS